MKDEQYYWGNIEQAIKTRDFPLLWRNAWGLHNCMQPRTPKTEKRAVVIEHLLSEKEKREEVEKIKGKMQELGLKFKI